jgi:hypothetical protein
MTAATRLQELAEGSGGSGSCVRAGMHVLTKDRGAVEIPHLRVGDHIRGRDTWTQVLRHEVHRADTFVRLTFSNDDSLDVTAQHVFTLADEAPFRANRLCLGDILVGYSGRLTLQKIELIVEEGAKVIVTCEPDQEFFAGRVAAAVLTHNYNLSS